MWVLTLDRCFLLLLKTAEILQPDRDWGMMTTSWLEANGTYKKSYTKKISRFLYVTEFINSFTCRSLKSFHVDANIHFQFKPTDNFLLFFSGPSKIFHGLAEAYRL